MENVFGLKVSGTDDLGSMLNLMAGGMILLIILNARRKPEIIK